MAGYLVAEEGPLSGLIVRFEEGTEWILGRDPDIANIVLEDPMVSRKHVICSFTSEGYLLENLSSVNPATQNGKVITEAVLLREGDIIQIGNTFFRFTEKTPLEEEKQEEKEEVQPSSFEETPSDLSSMRFGGHEETRWLLKVMAGPNSGAEFNMERASVYIIGKDPNLCDIVFQDLSVSRQHARLTIDENEKAFIEDLGSRNGVLVNGEPITEKKGLLSQDLVALGTTSFLVLDRKDLRETIVSPSFEPRERLELPEAETAASALTVAPPARDWKEMIIPRRHLIIAGGFLFALLLAFVAMFSLFHSEPISMPEKNESQQVQEMLHHYPDIQFSFNTNNGKLFLVGHVLTEVEKQELLYLIKGLPFVLSIDDNIVVDEYVWQNMNALLMSNSDWQGVSIHSPKPGRFVLKGYLQTIEQAQALMDYMNRNFPYLDRLENQLVVENNLSLQVQSMLTEKGLGAVAFELSNGELVLSGRVDGKGQSQFEEVIAHFKALPGIRTVKNYVVVTTAETSRVDLSTKYTVSGYSKKDDSSHFVVINGKILTTGDILDGMTITGVGPTSVFLEKDGLKFKINYNLQ